MRPVIRWLVAGSALLSAVSVVAVASGVEVPMALFAVVRERSVPTWYSSAMLLAGAGAFGWAAVLAGRTRRRLAGSLGGLAVILLAMSIDEVARFHEKLSLVGRLLVAEEGLTRFSWVVPGLALGLMLIVVVRRLAMPLPATTRRLLALGVALVLVAALGVEAVSGWVLDTYGERWHYAVAYHVEELIEMIGFAGLAAAGVSMLRLDADEDSVVVRLSATRPASHPSRDAQGERR